jgi:hypothetical protein
MDGISELSLRKGTKWARLCWLLEELQDSIRNCHLKTVFEKFGWENYHAFTS